MYRLSDLHRLGVSSYIVAQVFRSATGPGEEKHEKAGWKCRYRRSDLQRLHRVQQLCKVNAIIAGEE